MKKKVLFVATVDSHIELFHLPYLKMFKDHGYEVHVATNSDKKIKYCDKKIKLPIKRSPFRFSNLKAIFKLRKIMKAEKYDIVHCHTPMGGVVARLAAKKFRRTGTRVIYTAHGFHFYENAPLLNWVLYYPVEKWLSKYTDTLITINTEDFERAKAKFGKRCLDIQYVPGVGVDAKKFEKKLSEKQKKELRKSLGLKESDRVVIFPAELSKRKNQRWLIKALWPLFEKYKNLHLLLPGGDNLNGKCQILAKKLGLEKQIHFLGFRDDIPKLLQISDIAVSSSKQEGLPLNLVEAAILGIPIVATDCRGNRDICEMVGGKLSGQGDTEDFVKYVERGTNSNRKYDISKYTVRGISESMEKVYKLDKKLKLNRRPLKSVEGKTLKPRKKREKVIKRDYPIDFVVSWVDGGDSEWQKKKQKYKPEVNAKNEVARYRDWGTFKYWFRGVEKYAPWVNHIYLVTDKQKPEWLNIEHPKLTIVDHKEIMDSEDLPTFNSQAIEMNLHKIPGLSEHFVYFNDDTFIINPVKPKDFFRNGLPVEIANINSATGMEGDQLYAQTMFNDILLINRHFKKREVVNKHISKWLNLKYGSYNFRTLTQMPYPYFTGYKPHHLATSFLKSTFNEVWKKEYEAVKATCSHKFRHPNDLNQDVFVLWQLCKNKFAPRRKNVGVSIGLNNESDVRRITHAIKSGKKMLCINDGKLADKENEFRKIQNKILREFHKKMPKKSQFEKNVKKATILYVIHDLPKGGAEKYLMDLLGATYLDYESVIVCFGKNNEWGKEIENMGVKLIKAPDVRKKISFLRKVIRDYNVDVMYACTYYVSVYALIAAFLEGVKKRIIHSHGVGGDNLQGKIKRIIVKMIIPFFATQQLACGDNAGKKLFIRKKFTVIKNGIELDKFAYNLSEREHFRKAKHFNNKDVVIGVVGRLDNNKNQSFAVDIMNELIKQEDKYKLVIVGDGNNSQQLHNKVNALGLNKNVKFLGNVDDVENCYSGMDLLLLTSYREGFPYVLIEAQENGLPVLASMAVTEEAKINNNFCQMALKDGPKKWADKIVKMHDGRVEPSTKIQEHSLNAMVMKVKKIYE